MSCALVIGVGGLGCPAALSLAERGVRELHLVDPDRVELSNLQRQILFRTPDVGRPKVEVAAQRLAAAFPQTSVVPIEQRVGRDNIDQLIENVDVVLDCTDDPESRFIVNDAALAHGVPAVLGGVLRFDGLVLAVGGKTGPCFRCVFETPPTADEAATCGQAGVLGPLCGVVGFLQAERAWAMLEGHVASQTGFLTTVDGKRAHIRDIPLPEAAPCKACGGLAARLDISKYTCPMTYVRTRLALEALEPGETLDIMMRHGEPARNVPRSLIEEGHEVLIDGQLDAQRHRVVVRRASPTAP